MVGIKTKLEAQAANSLGYASTPVEKRFSFPGALETGRRFFKPECTVNLLDSWSGSSSRGQPPARHDLRNGALCRTTGRSDLPEVRDGALRHAGWPLGTLGLDQSGWTVQAREIGTGNRHGKSAREAVPLHGRDQPRSIRNLRAIGNLRALTPPNFPNAHLRCVLCLRKFPHVQSRCGLRLRKFPHAQSRCALGLRNFPHVQSGCALGLRNFPHEQSGCALRLRKNPHVQSG